MDELRHSLDEFRNMLISDKEGSNAEKLAFALGFFESLVTGLCKTDQRNFHVVQKQIIKYMENR